jgi:hypothetical protein
MTVSAWDAAALSPWEAAQLVVSLHLGGGAKIAKLVPEEWIRRDGAPVVYRTLRLWSDPLDFLRSPPAVRLRKLREGRIPMRTERLFRAACAKLEDWWKVGRLAGELHPLTGGIPRRLTSEYSMWDIDFQRGRLTGESLRLDRASVLKAWAEDESAKQRCNDGAGLTEEHNSRQEISVSENTPPKSHEAQHDWVDAEASKMTALKDAPSKLVSSKTVKAQRWGSAIKKTTHDVLRNEGPLDPELPEWSRKSHLERVVRNRLDKKYPEETKDGGPGPTTLKKYVSEALVEFTITNPDYSSPD